MVSLLARPVKLLPKSGILHTSPIDHPFWNYRPLLGSIQRLRFRIILELLSGTHFDRLLEVGYGSGVFMPELSGHCDKLYGVDPHAMRSEVEKNLARHGIHGSLATAQAESLPYETGYFNCIVAVSTLEYVKDIAAASREIRRVLKPGGRFAVCTPGVSPIWNIPLHVLTREGPSQYDDRRHNLQAALRSQFRVVREIQVPPFAGNTLRLYTGLYMQAD